MTEVARWWAARVDASRREPRLAGAILGRRYVRYAAHRLRGFAVARGAGVALYVLEASVLLRVLPPRAAIVAFLAAHSGALLNGFWWGATEVQRIAVRETPRDADRVTAIWLTWAIRLAAAALVVAGGLAIALRARPLAAAYALVLGIRIAADLPLRVWHGRISAERRIQRVMWMQVAVEAVGPLLVLLLVRTIEAWGFFVAMAASTAVSRAMTWTFIRRAYRMALVPWIRPRHRPPALPWWRALALGVAGIATRIPTVIGVVFLAVPGLPLTVAIGFNLAVGALAAAGGWAWTHYQDFVAIEWPVYARVRARVERLVMGEAVAVGVLAGAAVLAVVYLAAPRTLTISEPGVVVLIAPKFPDPWPYALALPALTLGLSVLAACQVIAWMRRAFVAVAASGVIASLAVRYAGDATRRLVTVPARGDLPASVVRAEHVVMAAVLLATGAALWLVTRGARAARIPRVPWAVAQARAAIDPAGVRVFTIARSGGLLDAFEDRLAHAGATWWARRDRSWLVAGLPPAAVAALIVECAGLVIGVAPYRADPVSPTSAREPAPYRFRLDGPSPRYPELTEYQLHQIWRALDQRLEGGRPPRGVLVSELELAGETIAGFSARLRERKRG